MRLNVSAVILPRIACSSAIDGGGEPTFRCSSSDPTTTYRVRSDRNLRTGGPNPPRTGANPDPVVLSIEP